MSTKSIGSALDSMKCGLVYIPDTDTGCWRYGAKIKYPVPLRAVRVDCKIVQCVAEVEVTQVFVNEEVVPIEAVYYFPIDPGGAVTSFEVDVGGRKIKGVVKSKEEANSQYELLCGRFYDEELKVAYVGEEVQQDIFKVRVGDLRPRLKVTIIIKYVTEVKKEKHSDALRFYVPTTVAPRYVPRENMDSEVEELLKMKFSEFSPAPVTIAAQIIFKGEIDSIASPTHRILVRNGTKASRESEPWTEASVSLSGKTTDMDRDFVLLITPTEPHRARLYVENSTGSLAVMAHLVPSFNLKEQRAELIFVLDRSGSMFGKGIELAKKAQIFFLHSLPADCHFNVVGFGSSYELLFPRSVRYDDFSLKVAVDYARDKANFGGTEILQPLKEVFASGSIAGYLRQIFVITDGQVGNTDQVIGFVKAKAHESRVFALGIGAGASHHLVEGIAEAGGGSSAFVTYDEPVDEKVLQQLKDALQSSLTNVRVTWDGVPDQITRAVNTRKTLMGYGKSLVAAPLTKTFCQAPEKVPPIFDGPQMVVIGVFKDSKPLGCTFTADSPEGPLSIHLDAAVKIIKELETKRNALKYSPEKNKEELSYVGKQIEEIGLREGIVSRLTSYIAIDTSSERRLTENWIMHTRMIPSQYHYGLVYTAQCGGGWLTEEQQYETKLKWAAKRPEVIEHDPLEDIVKFQSFNGSFNWKAGLLEALEMDTRALKQRASKENWDLNAWATALAVTYLFRRLPERKASWELIALKATKWLSTNYASIELKILAAANSIIQLK